MPSAAAMRAQGLSEAAIQQAIGTKGTRKVAVILANFPSADSTTSGNATITNLTGNNSVESTFSSMTAYYTEASYGQITLQITFYGVQGASSTPSGLTPYTMPQPMESYGAEPLVPNEARLIQDALTTAGPAVNSTAFDAVMVCHAGIGEESGGKTGDIWSVYLKADALTGGNPNKNGFTDGTVVPAIEVTGAKPLGVTCHEFGHQLGLPDLYNTNVNPSTTQIKEWDLMDNGTWTGNLAVPKEDAGAAPTHFGAWSKTFLGWAAPTVLSGVQLGVVVQKTEGGSAAGAFYKVETTAGPKEYFLLEYRKKEKYDRALPDQGLLIWHIDENVVSSTAIANNNVNITPAHRGVDVEGPNKTDPADNTNMGPFPKGTKNSFVSPQSDTYPKTVGGAATPSGVTIVNIGPAGGETMKADVLKTAISTSEDPKERIEPKEVSAFPNPAPEGRATIQFVLAKPASPVTIDIYSLSGERVRKVEADQVRLLTAQDFRYTYQYQWDGLNDGGEQVATGLYFYNIRTTDDPTQKQFQHLAGKLAVIR